MCPDTRGDGPQCASVKGLSPVMNGSLWVPTCLASRKATSEGPTAMAPANPSGSKTGARHHGKAGNLGDPMDSSKEGGRVAQPAHREETRRSVGRRMSPSERRRWV